MRLLAAKKVLVDDPNIHSTKQIRKAGGADLTLPKVRRNPLIEIIAISTGCLNQAIDFNSDRTFLFLKNITF